MKLHQFGLIDGEDQRALSRKTVGVILLRGVPPELELILKAYLRIWQQLLLGLERAGTRTGKAYGEQFDCGGVADDTWFWTGRERCDGQRASRSESVSK